MSKHKALIVGASGLVGGSFLSRLEQADDWDIVAISRRPPAFAGRAAYRPVDLLDKRQCEDAASTFHDVTHVFFCARAVETDYVIKLDPNREIVENLLDALIPRAQQLQHVQIIHGMKWYGSNLGPYRTPAKEWHPRLPGPNFYYEQLGAIVQRQKGASWSWSSLRPHFVFGVTVGSPSNPLSTLGTYAAILRELGEPLHFPASAETFDAHISVTDVRLLTAAMVWAATAPRCANEAFNIVNGDTFRWRDIWPVLAEQFRMQSGAPKPMKLRDFMSDKESVWAAVVRKYNLRSTKMQDIADWSFADVLFAGSWDQTASVVKAHKFGFTEMVDTEEMFVEILQRYRELRLLP